MTMTISSSNAAKTNWRMCQHIEKPCQCSDLEAQPCVAALIADYLEALRGRYGLPYAPTCSGLRTSRVASAVTDAKAL
jgi:hypothetical protein